MAYGKRITKSRRLYNQKKDVFILRFSVVVLILLLILFGFIYLSRIEFFRIKTMTTEGNSVTSSQDIERIVEENIAGFYFKMFSKRNVLLYPKNKIKKDLMDEFQRIEDVDLAVKDFSDLKIVIEEREPDILWCGTKFDIIGNEDCYFIDADGLIYSKAPNFSGNVFLRAYGDISASDPIGVEFLPVSKYQSLKFFHSTIRQYGLTPIFIIKLSNDDMEVRFEEGGKLIYNSEQDMVKLADDIGSILKDPEFKDGLNSGELELDYIDLRLGNKVYYRFK
jgi:hypothetical protein